MNCSREIIVLCVLFFVSTHGCITVEKTPTQKEMNTDKADEKRHRPSFHFTPKKNWMNDPNGMFYLKGTYHLYFQYHPESNVWGPMHWGHATSKDLIHWDEQPIALYPDALGTIFSGSTVVDHNNTSGFGKAGKTPIIAIYTNHDAEAEKRGSQSFQTQSIAYSLDEGYTWTKYTENPIIENPGLRDFRDPKVIWYEKEQKWVLILAAAQQTQFYESKNLKQWTFLSSFGEGIGNHTGVWECPDLFELPVRGTAKKKWVHLVSINPGGPNGGSATQYFVGEFDGKQFTVDSSFEHQMEQEHTFWTDFGKDNYAGVTYSNWKSEALGVLYQGWMSNWEYAQQVPTSTWRSAMTLPRELELVQQDTGIYRIRSRSFVNWEPYTAKTIEKKKISLEGETLLVDKKTIDLSGAIAQMDLAQLDKTTYTFVLANPEGDTLQFGYNHDEKQFFIDRKQSGQVDFSETFSAKPSVAPRFISKETLNIKLILDKASIELFYDEGATVMTEIFFTNAPFETMTAFTSATKSRIENFSIKELKTN